MTLLSEVLDAKLPKKEIAVYGIANNDIEFSFTREQLERARIHPVFDRYARSVIDTHQFSEFGISEREFDAIQEALIRHGKRPRSFVGGNAGNIALQLAALGMRPTLVVKSAPRPVAAALRKAGVTMTRHTASAGNDSLIFQVQHDRFILSKPSGARRVELDPEATGADLSIYSGAHLDGRTPKTNRAFRKALKKLQHPLMVELGDAQASPYSRLNNLAAAKEADIISMNEKEARELSGKTRLDRALGWFMGNTHAGIVVVHTAAGSLSLSAESSPAICHAQMLGGLAGTGRVVTGRVLSFSSLKRRFRDARFQSDPAGLRFKRCLQKRIGGRYWGYVPSPIPTAGRMRMVGAGDSFAAGFAAGLLGFAAAQDY